MDAYLLVKFVHVLLAILALGTNLTYVMWRAFARGDREHLRFTLHGIERLDQVANAGYGLLLVTGLTMVFMHQIPLTTLWIAAGLILYVAVAVTGAAVYSRVARTQRTLLETVGPADAAYRAVEGRAAQLGVFVTALVVAIVFFMVVKPTL